MRERRLAICASLAIALGMLAGCSVPPTFPDLEREAGTDDVLSEGFANLYSDELKKIDVETVRLAAHDGETALYLMRTLTGGICLEIKATREGSMLACTSAEGSVAASSPAGTYQVRPAPIPQEDGWRILSANVRVREGSSPAEPTPSPWESTPGPVEDSGARTGAMGEASGVGATTYVVVDGDTASDIATRFDVGLEQLMDEQGQRLGRAPSLTPGDRVQFGEPLTGDDYDCFFGLAAPKAKGETCYG